MKKLLLFLAFVGCLFFLYLYLKAPQSNPLYLSPSQQISPVSPEKQIAKEKDKAILDMIRVINTRNDKIQTFVCNDIDIKYSKNIRVRLSGTMAMEKEKKFRMKVRSIAGQEIDIGSNDTHFWFWSKRMEPPVLHYAKHEDLGKSLLKTPLNPEWLMGSLNLGRIEDSEDAQLIRHNQNYGILNPKVSANGEEITIFTLIDPNKQAVIGHYLYGANGKLQASSEVKTHQTANGFIIPKEMLIIWYAEGVQLEWSLNKPQINVGISQQTWVMPTMRGAIDMGR